MRGKDDWDTRVRIKCDLLVLWATLASKHLFCVSERSTITMAIFEWCYTGRDITVIHCHKLRAFCSWHIVSMVIRTVEHSHWIHRYSFIQCVLNHNSRNVKIINLTKLKLYKKSYDYTLNFKQKMNSKQTQQYLLLNLFLLS